MLCIFVAYLLPKGIIPWRRRVPHFTLIASLSLCNAALVVGGGCYAIGNARICNNKAVSLLEHIVKSQIAEAEIVAELTFGIAVNYVLKHRIDANRVNSPVLRHLIENSFSPGILYGIRWMKHASTPKFILLS